MPDVIKILPDSVANQIAAGEVVQRPASVVKELLENSIDSGATDIKLIVKDAGRTLIQVTDDGSGMSETDARLCFERHATSKINDSKDLFAIKTMGFRGEALASIAAIAQVELKTKKSDNDLGTEIHIEASVFKSQQACICPDGTAISVKNIFFNVPARRNFLKSDQVELNHIIEEFQRIALGFPDISLSLFSNNKEIFHLQPKSSLKQRIAAIFGKSYNEKLIPVDQETDYVRISGFIGKPEFAKKNRGEQFFFVNNRFIKHPYLNHAVTNAFVELIPSSTFPTYFIFFDIDPKTIDINIHPTKTEILFRDEKMIYAVLLSTVKLSLGKFNITPTIDFEIEKSFDLPSYYKNKIPQQPQIKINPDYNPFDKPKIKGRENIYNAPSESPLAKINKQNWEKLYEDLPQHEKKSEGRGVDSSPGSIDTENKQGIIHPDWDSPTALLANKNIIQVNEKYIITKVKSGILIVNQYNANERIYYEHYLNILDSNSLDIQQQLFPQQIELTPADAEILREIKTDLDVLGFDINEFGANTFVVNGIPADTRIDNIQEVIEGFIESYKTGLGELKLDKRTNLALSMAKSIAGKVSRYLNEVEMLGLIDQLFACKIPNLTTEGKKTYTIISFDEIENKLK